MGAEKEYGKRNAVPELNTQALELPVISTLKFYSFLSIFMKFYFQGLRKVVALRLPFLFV